MYMFEYQCISLNIDVYDLISIYMFEYQCISIRWIFVHMFDGTNRSSLSHDK